MTSNRETIKIAARELDDKSLTNILPNWKDILIQIENFREASATTREGSEFPEFYNVISILGKRGSGKSSVLLSVKKSLEKFKYTNNDIILRLIVPDKMSGANDVLGWIIGDIEKEVEKRKKNDENENSICCRQAKDPVSEDLNSLKKAYYQRKNEYQDIIRKNYAGNFEYISDNSEILKSDLDLIERFNTLLDSLLKSKKNTEENTEEDKKVKPMLFIFFDDVDISADRGPEILKTIMTFLTHPKIVTFVSGDLEVFSEIQTVDFLNREHILDAELMEKNYTDNDYDFHNSALELRKERSVEYLKKIMPPAYRFSIASLTSMGKKNFKYSYQDESLYDLINEILHLEAPKDDLDAGLFETILSDNPRSLMNVYYYLSTSRDDFFKIRDNEENEISRNAAIDREEISELRNNYIIGLLNVLIESNEKFYSHRGEIRNFIYEEGVVNKEGILNKGEKWIIDFESLILARDGNYRNKHDGKAGRDNWRTLYHKETINIVILGVFMREIIKQIMGEKFYKEIGENPLSTSINRIKKDIIPVQSFKFLLILYTRFLKDLTDYDKLLNVTYPELNTKYFNIIRDILEVEVNERAYNEAVRKEAQKSKSEKRLTRKNVTVEYYKVFEKVLLRWYYKPENEEWVKNVIIFLYNVRPSEEYLYNNILQKCYTILPVEIKPSINEEELFNTCREDASGGYKVIDDFIKYYPVEEFSGSETQNILKNFITDIESLRYEGLDIKFIYKYIYKIIDKVTEDLGTFLLNEKCCEHHIAKKLLEVDRKIMEMLKSNVDNEKYKLLSKIQKSAIEKFLENPDNLEEQYSEHLLSRLKNAGINTADIKISDISNIAIREQFEGFNNKAEVCFKDSTTSCALKSVIRKFFEFIVKVKYIYQTVYNKPNTDSEDTLVKYRKSLDNHVQQNPHHYVDQYGFTGLIKDVIKGKQINVSPNKEES